MNQIRAIQALNKKEIENGISPEASWHTDYRDTAFVYFGGLPFDLSEGDVITIFSQFGEPVFLKIVRDKETGKSKGFGWLKYEDQRSTDLAVDNLGGASISGRMIKVDHARYKPREDEDLEGGKISWEDLLRKEGKDVEEGEEEESEDDRPLLPEERELQLLIRDHDDDDPMKAYLVDEKKQEVAEALRKYNRDKEKKRHRHRHHHRSHRTRRNDDPGRDAEEGRTRRSRRDSSRERYRHRSRDRETRRGNHGERRPRDEDSARSRHLDGGRDRSRDRRRYRQRDEDEDMRDVDDERRRDRPGRSRSRSPAARRERRRG
ncbi:hypothetical protein MKZ38_006201 [Zalerion maritima]|uniref:RRM domain-containing protein n=1 Tax=Zalerion maritima TaxID=339359 RepID=A0AAD5RJD7_9PEZI|nr:hypothetical protein MKZ38_006201 [Zalerion maritima]